MNHVLLVGNLTRDPEVRTGTDGEIEAYLRLAVDRPGGRGTQRADFLTVVCEGHQARLARDYLRRGRLVAVNARLQADPRTGALRIRARYVTHLHAGGRSTAARAGTGGRG